MIPRRKIDVSAVLSYYIGTMETQELVGQLESSDPLGLYPIRVVAAQTGLGVHTLRAWERRYGLPRPTRTAGEHRLYRMEDIVLLRRVQALIARGTPPSRACSLVLEKSDDAGPSDDSEMPTDGYPDTNRSSSPAMALCAQLRVAFISLDEEAASSALCEAFTLFGPELALEQVVLPTLVNLGTAWAEGSASIATEHFASSVIRARLLSAFEGACLNDRQPLAVLGAGPGDQHEIPSMALALLLRRRGWRTIFLGQDTPLEALRDAISRTNPYLVCLSAATLDTVPALVKTFTALRRMPEFTAVVLGYGGAPFRDHPTLRHQLEGIGVYLGDDLRQAANRAHVLLLGDSAQRAKSSPA